MKSTKKKKSYKITKEQVLEIKNAIKNKARIFDLAETYNVTPSSISGIKHNRYYKGIGDDVSQCPRYSTKVSLYEVELIRSKDFENISNHELAKALNVTPKTILKIKKNISYKIKKQSDFGNIV